MYVPATLGCVAMVCISLDTYRGVGWPEWLCCVA